MPRLASSLSCSLAARAFSWSVSLLGVLVERRRQPARPAQSSVPTALRNGGAAARRGHLSDLRCEARHSTCCCLGAGGGPRKVDTNESDDVIEESGRGVRAADPAGVAEVQPQRREARARLARLGSVPLHHLPPPPRLAPPPTESASTAMSNLLAHKSIRVAKPTRGHQPLADGAIRSVVITLSPRPTSLLTLTPRRPAAPTTRSSTASSSGSTSPSRSSTTTRCAFAPSRPPHSSPAACGRSR